MKQINFLTIILILSWVAVVLAQPAPQPVLDMAEDIGTDTTNFDNNLSAADDDVQKALDTLDDVVGGGTPGGSDTQVQFNDGGSFGGDAGLTYNKTTDTLTSNGIISIQNTGVVQLKIKDTGAGTSDAILSLEDDAGNAARIFFDDDTNSLAFSGDGTGNPDLLIDASGNVGIGDTTPDALFDVTGASQFDGAVTVGVDSTGYDVKFFGTTTGKYLLWDESRDALSLPTNVKMELGDTGTFIYHDGTNLIIEDDTNVTIGVAGDIEIGDSTLRVMKPQTNKAITLGGSSNFFEGLWSEKVMLSERSSDPPQPSEGEAVIWLSDGTGKGDDGDVMIATQAGGVTKYGTLFDHSAGTNW